jgi:hypothetical protein
MLVAAGKLVVDADPVALAASQDGLAGREGVRWVHGRSVKRVTVRAVGRQKSVLVKLLADRHGGVRRGQDGQ